MEFRYVFNIFFTARARSAILCRDAHLSRNCKWISANRYITIVIFTRRTAHISFAHLIHIPTVLAVQASHTICQSRASISLYLSFFWLTSPSEWQGMHAYPFQWRGASQRFKCILFSYSLQSHILWFVITNRPHTLPCVCYEPSTEHRKHTSIPAWISSVVMTTAPCFRQLNFFSSLGACARMARACD